MFNYNQNYNQNYNHNCHQNCNQTNNQKCVNTNNVVNFETLQNARRDLIGELEAIIQYDDHLHKTNVELAKSTWENIRNEELTHVGELLGLLYYLAPYQKCFVEKGLKEFNERMCDR